MFRNKYKTTALFLALVLSLSGCGSTGENNSANVSSSASSSSSVQQSSVNTSEMFSDRDFEIGYDETESVQILLNGSSAGCDSDAVKISGSTITLTDEGTYILSGTLENGMILVDAEETDKLQIVLNGVSISNQTSASIYIRQADKVFLTTASDTENFLSNGGEYAAIDENNIDSVIFSKSDLTMNGEGSLTIDAEAGHGIVSKDDLVITSGDYTISSASHGISGKDSVRIANGTFLISSGKDGIQAENADDSSLGFLYISGGDGMSAGNYLLVEDGTYTIEAGGGAENVSVQGNSFWNDVSASSADSSVSTKGIKATGELTVYGGNFTINSADDAIHSNSSIFIYDGNFQISTGDDGAHADATLNISSGTIEITESYEGLEGQSIDISGGEIILTASDDGLNAAGGNDQSGLTGMGGGFRGPDNFEADSDAYIHISGGVLRVNASGDGIDSNGSLTVSGGEIYISGPDNGGNGALDYASEASISGGIFIASGASQMAQNFSSSSTQGVMMVTVNSQQAGTEIILMDSENNELIA